MPSQVSAYSLGIPTQQRAALCSHAPCLLSPVCRGAAVCRFGAPIVPGLPALCQMHRAPFRVQSCARRSTPLRLRGAGAGGRCRPQNPSFPVPLGFPPGVFGKRVQRSALSVCAAAARKVGLCPSYPSQNKNINMLVMWSWGGVGQVSFLPSDVVLAHACLYLLLFLILIQQWIYTWLGWVSEQIQPERSFVLQGVFRPWGCFGMAAL